jgi:hypothetical protein
LQTEILLDPFYDPDTLNLGAFQLGGQQSPDEEESWCLAAALPLPNTTILSLHNADDLVANFREIHPLGFFT